MLGTIEHFYQAVHVDVQTRRKWRKNVFTIEIRSSDMQRMQFKKKNRYNRGVHTMLTNSLRYTNANEIDDVIKQGVKW